MKHTRMIALLAALLLCAGILSACTSEDAEGTQPSGTLPIPELRPGESLSPEKGSGEARTETELTIPPMTEFKPGIDPFASHEATKEAVDSNDEPDRPAQPAQPTEPARPTEPAPPRSSEAQPAPTSPSPTPAPAPQQPPEDSDEDIIVSEYDDTDEELP